MNVLVWLIPLSFLMAGMAFAAFIWTVGTGQYDDPEGDASRILEHDDQPLDQA